MTKLKTKFNAFLDSNAFDYCLLGTGILVVLPATIVFSPVFLVLGGLGWCIQRLGLKFGYNLLGYIQ